MELEDLHQSKAYTELNAKINTLLTATSLDELYDCVLVNAEKRVDPALLAELLGLVSASRRGLSEQELAELTGQTLSSVATVCRGLASHLVRRNGLLTFSHDGLRKAVENRYLCNIDRRTLHLRLAVWFSHQPLASRRVDEQSWQLLHAEAFSELKDCIADIPMFMELNSADRKSDLAEYWRALENRCDMVVEYGASLRSYRRGITSRSEQESVYGAFVDFFAAHDRQDGIDLLRSLFHEVYRRISPAPRTHTPLKLGRRMWSEHRPAELSVLTGVLPLVPVQVNAPRR